MPSIGSDKADYAPGGLVTLNGENWQAGETVHININDDLGKTWQRDVNVVADANGQIVDQFNLPDFFVATYAVTASGPSGTAKTSFTDANANATPTRVPSTLLQSVSAGTSFDFSISYTKNTTSGKDPILNMPIITANDTSGGHPTCGGFGTLIPASWISVVSPALPTTVSGTTVFSYRVSVPAGQAGGTYTANVLPSASDGGAQAFDLCLSVPAGKSDQTITFVQPTSPAAYNSTFTVSPTASSGLTVSVAASGACSILGSTVTMTSGTGTCTLTASQAGNASFNAAPDVVRTVTASKLNQTITFGALAPKTFGDADFAVSATASSGLAVSFSALGDCNFNGLGQVHITGAGSCTITALQAGDANYNAASSVPQAFTIAKATATLALSNLSQTYDGSSKSATVTTTPSGLAGVSVTYDGSATAPTNAGSYAVVASLTNPNYTATNASGTLVIAKAGQTITFPPIANKTYGDAAFTPPASATSSLPVSLEVKAGSNSKCTVSANQVTITGAGSCTLVATQSGNGNYNPAPSVEQSFTIGKAHATLTISNLSATYDGTAKPVTVTTSPAGLSGVAVTYAGSATAPKNAGSYAVIASLNNDNYEATNATDTLVIAPKPITGSFTANNKVYDGDNSAVVASR
ncbi:MAG TPA: MBG domain-containing protein, partial [Jatrophihabitantaceae bacterium]